MLKNVITRIDLKKYEHAKYMLIIPLYMVIFLIEEKNITADYFVSYIPLDDLIPFCEWFVIPYFCWYPLMLGTGAYLFLRDAEGFRNYMLFVGGGFLIIVLLYAVFPNGQNLRPTVFEHSNILTDIVKLVYQSDSNTNVCPSLHVVGTLGATSALLSCGRLNKLWFKASIIFLSFTICISTVFIKQHSFLDVILGAAFSLVYYIIVYKWLPRLSNGPESRKKLKISR